MDYGIRCFFVKTDNSVERIPQSVWAQGIYPNREKTFQQYRNRSVRTVVAICQLKNGKPFEIKNMDCTRVYFDSEGRSIPVDLYLDGDKVKPVNPKFRNRLWKIDAEIERRINDSIFNSASKKNQN